MNDTITPQMAEAHDMPLTPEQVEELHKQMETKANENQKQDVEYAQTPEVIGDEDKPLN